MKVNALNVVTFVCDLKQNLQLTNDEIEMIENNGLLRFDLAKVITNFSFEQKCKSIEELKLCKNIKDLYPTIRSIIDVYKN